MPWPIWNVVADAYRDFAIDNPTYYGIMFRSTVHGFQPSPEAAELGLHGLDFVHRAGPRRPETGA